MKNKILLAIIIVIGIILTLFILWDNGIIIINKTSEYEVRGVDVSAYQGEIDWNILAEQDIQFVFIKATEGSSYVDEKFKTNYENAIKTDLKIGAYHFFSYDSEGTTQADNFIKHVPKFENMLPPVIDIEFYGEKYRNIPDVQETQKQLTQMIVELEEYYQKKPIIYATYKSYDLYIANNFSNYPIWIRDVFSTPELSDKRDWTFWQYTDKAKMEGYNGKEKSIDVNVFKGSIEELNNLCKTTIQDKKVEGFVKEINSEYISITDGEGNITKVEIKEETELINYRTEEIIKIEEIKPYDYYKNGQIIRNLTGDELRKELLRSMAVAFDGSNLCGLPKSITNVENKGDYIIVTVEIIDACSDTLGKEFEEVFEVKFIANKDTKIPTHSGENLSFYKIKEETEGFIYWIKVSEKTLEDEYPLITLVEIYDK